MIMHPLNVIPLFCTSLIAAASTAEDVVVTMEHVSGESGLVYASQCCVPDFFLPGDGYVQTSNCGTTSSGACAQLRSMGVWLYSFPETPPGGELLSIVLKGDRYASSGLFGTGVLLIEFVSDDYLSSASLYQVLNSPDQQVNITWPSVTDFSFGIPKEPFEANPQQSFIALVAYKPSSTITYIDNNSGNAPVLEFRFDVEVVDLCPEDIDGNESVDGGDLSIVLGSWGLDVDPHRIRCRPDR